MKLRNIIASLFAVAALSSCVTIENPDPSAFVEPTVSLTSASASVSTITMVAKISNAGAAKAGFNYGYSKDMGTTRTVTAAQNGSFTLTVPVEKWDATFYCQAFIENSNGKRILSEAKQLNTPAMPAGGVSISSESATLKEGEVVILTATVTPDTAKDKSVSWRSTNTAVATVSQEGAVTAVKAGEAQVIVKTNDGGYEAVCNIVVLAPVAGISLDRSNAMLAEGGSITLNATVLPANASEPKLSWSSSNEKVAKVNGGSVTAVAGGCATVTATVSDQFGSFSTSCEIYVYKSVVDLGLSVKWSGANLGAESPLYPGNRYAWAEIEPKPSCSWSNYLYGDGSVVTKYCLDRTYGMMDFLNTLSASDDVATVKVGADWHTPSVAEWTELREKCKWEALTIEGRAGYKVSGTGDHAEDWIFLPLCGRKVDSSIELEGSEGYYWSSVLSDASSLKAQNIKLAAESSSLEDQDRCNGFSVRPVQGEAPEVHVMAVDLNLAKAAMLEGCQLKLEATIYPLSASNRSVSWSSSNADVVGVDENGTMTALAKGSATVTVTTADGGKTASCEVTVLPHVAEVSLNKNSLLLKVGDTEALKATVLPEDAFDRSVSWSSSDPAVATVDKNGTVKALAQGTTTITVISTEGNKSANCIVNVISKLESVTLDITEATVSVGDSQEIRATIAPADAAISGVTWSSSDPAVASVTYTLEGNVSKAKVKGKALGESDITVTVTDAGGESKSASCHITVKSSLESVTLDVTELNMTEGDVSEIVATMQPSDASVSGVAWSSSDPSVASVTYTLDGNISKARVKANAGGTSVIKVTVTDVSGETMTASCTVTVKAGAVMPTYIRFNKNFVTITEGQSAIIADLGLFVEVGPENASNKGVAWSSAAPEIFTIDGNGVITAHTPGVADLTGTTVNGLKATCQVTVLKK